LGNESVVYSIELVCDILFYLEVDISKRGWHLYKWEEQIWV
jgi:hypothetical protein